MRALKWIAFALVGLFVAASLARPIGQQTIEIATKSGRARLHGRNCGQ